jgi:hypothetical protein
MGPTTNVPDRVECAPFFLNDANDQMNAVILGDGAHELRRITGLRTRSL